MTHLSSLHCASATPCVHNPRATVSIFSTPEVSEDDEINNMTVTTHTYGVITTDPRLLVCSELSLSEERHLDHDMMESSISNEA